MRPAESAKYGPRNGLVSTVMLASGAIAWMTCSSSVLSPAGMALLGLSAGQRTQYVFPDSIRHYLRVEAVLHQPEYKLRMQLIVRG